MLLTQTAIGDYEQLCRMDVLGLADTPSGDQGVVHAEFLEEQITFTEQIVASDCSWMPSP